MSNSRRNGTVNGTITLGSQAVIDGDVYVPGGTSVINDPSKVTGTIYDPSAVSVSVREPVEPRVPPLRHAPATELIEAKWYELRTPIENESEYFTDDTCTGGGCDLTLGMGQYNTTELRITGEEEVTFNTTDGDIEIYVENEVRIEQGNHVNIVGDGTVTIYVNGTSGHEDVYMLDVTVGNVTSHDSTALRILTRPSAHVGIGGSTDFVGVIYGPGSKATSGTAIRLDNQAEVFGAVIGDFAGPDAYVSNDVEVHYDRTLARLDELPDGDENRFTDPSTVKCLQLSVGSISVGSY